LVEAEADRVHHHLQLTLPRIERDEARARSRRRSQRVRSAFDDPREVPKSVPLRRGAFAKHDLELRIASCGFPLMIFD
jgi:hypothetical protein